MQFTKFSSPPLVAMVVASLAFVGAWRWRETRVAAAEALASCPVGWRDPLPPASELANDARFNPSAVALSAVQTDELQALVDGTNGALAQAQEPLQAVARQWAKLRVDNGDYRIADDFDVQVERGTLLIRVVERDGLIKDVHIRPGECAELDVIAAESEAVLESGRSAVRDYFSKCSSRTRSGT